MKQKLFLIFAAFVMFAGTANAKYGYGGSDYLVGTAKLDITPNQEEAVRSCLGGYGDPFSRCGSTGVLDPITVRSLSISDDDTTVIFAVLDTIGVGDSVISEIKDSVFSITSGAIEKESIQISATHTHAGPDLQGLWGGVSPEYRQRVINQAALSIVLAKYTEEEAKISALRIDNGANVENRRGWPIVDKGVSVLDIRSKYKHRRIATLLNMSAHPTILDASNFSYSAGYVHFLRKVVEKRLGGNAVFINGRMGDAAPVTNGQATYSEVRRFGKSIARKVVRNIWHAEPVQGDLELETFDFSHPVTNLPVIGAVQAGLLDLEIDENFNVNTQFSLMSIGDDVEAILFPGEILTRLAEPIVEQLDGKYKFFFGLTDDSLGYFIPSDEFLQIDGRDTEERASLDVNVGDAIKASILDAID